MPKGIIYDKSFKIIIADLYNSNSMSALNIEREYGVGNSTIYKWS